MIIKINSRKKRLIISIAAALCIIVITVVLWIISKTKPTDPPLTFTAQKRDIYVTEGVSGYVGYGSSFVVTAPQDQPVKEIFVSFGDSVKQGDILFSLDTSESEQELAEYEQLYNDLENTKYISDEYENQTNTLSQKSQELLLSIARQEYETALGENETLSAYITEYSEELSDYIRQRDIIANELQSLYVSDLPEADESDEESESYLPTEPEVPDEKTEISDTDMLSESDIETYILELQTKYDVINEKCEMYSTLLEQAQNDLEENNEKIKESLYSIEKAELQESSGTNTSFDESLLQIYSRKIDEIKSNIENSVYYSPADGVVIELNIEEGLPLFSEAAVTIADSTEKTLELSLYAEKRHLMKEGMRVTVSSDMTGAYVTEGKLIGLSDVLIGNEYRAKVLVDSSDLEKFLGGEKIYARVYISEKQDVLAVPYESIEEDSGKEYVYVNKDGKSEKTEVKTGLETDYYTEISGLEEGTVIFLSAKEGKALSEENDK